MAACLGMCGIVLDVTVKVRTEDTHSHLIDHHHKTHIRIYTHLPTQITIKFNPDTDAVEVTRGRRPLSELFPPRGTPINESYNPLRVQEEEGRGCCRVCRVLGMPGVASF